MYGQKYDTHTPPDNHRPRPSSSQTPPSRGDLLASDIGLSSRLSKGVRNITKQNNRKGYLWGDRFKSVIVQDGRTLLHCLASINLNPVRTNMVQRPEDYH
ncbi:MAG: hypothetical protein PHO79_02855 [Desulfoplanes sp.]|nr:hypothetical protein [Desulfoplanes sp.]